MENCLSLLPATKEVISQQRELAELTVLVLQHALRDTSHFIRLLKESNVDVPVFVAKPNSIDPTAVASIAAQGVEVIQEPPDITPYSYFENSSVLLDTLEKHVVRCRASGRKLAVLDVGGYFLKPLRQLSSEYAGIVAGVVEVTTFGLNRYLANAATFPYPIISLARSPLKDAEAVHVGETVVQATEDMLREVGYILTGKICGVIGYGMIGSRIAHALKRREIPVKIGDQDNSLELHARLNGTDTASINEILATCDIVFSATASQSVSVEMLRSAKDGIMLVSGGSRANEFDVAGIRNQAASCEELPGRLEKFTFPWGKSCVLANKGKAANFIKGGSPEEVMDVVFAEQAMCLAELAVGQLSPGKVHELKGSERNEIASIWNTIQKNGGMVRFRAGVEAI